MFTARSWPFRHLQSRRLLWCYSLEGKGTNVSPCVAIPSVLLSDGRVFKSVESAAKYKRNQNAAAQTSSFHIAGTPLADTSKLLSRRADDIITCATMGRIATKCQAGSSSTPPIFMKDARGTSARTSSTQIITAGTRQDRVHRWRFGLIRRFERLARPFSKGRPISFRFFDQIGNWRWPWGGRSGCPRTPKCLRSAAFTT